MRDEEYITKYLESNYYLVADRSFLYCRKINEKYVSEVDVQNELLLIFGNFTGLRKIFSDWSDYYKNIITKTLVDYFDNLDLSLGSYYLQNKLSSEEKFSINYKREFINAEFENYYITKKINEINSKTKKKLDELNSTQLNSTSLVSLIIDGSVKEINSITDKLNLEINGWYYENVFKEKLDVFFKDCWLSLGQTNWIVRHPMYGSFDEKTIVNIFAGETDFQKAILKKHFDAWYEENVYNASEKAILGLYL